VVNTQDMRIPILFPIHAYALRHCSITAER
jgi:hypothetical protein